MKTILHNKLKIIIILVIIINATACTLIENKQDNTNKDSLDNKTEVVEDTDEQVPITDNDELYKTQDYTIPKIVDYSNFNEAEYIKSTFRPIGWSKDGKFAYVEEPADEACGCYFFRFVIQDMKNDKLIYEWDYNDEGAGDTMDSVWTRQYATFKQNLNDSKIIQNRDITIKQTDINYEGKNYRVVFETNTQEDPDFGFDVINEIAISVNSTTEDAQLFHYIEKAYTMLLNADLAGYIENPYDDKIAVVSWQMQRGYEGPPHVIQFGIVGVDMSTIVKPN